MFSYWLILVSTLGDLDWPVLAAGTECQCEEGQWDAFAHQASGGSRQQDAWRLGPRVPSGCIMRHGMSPYTWPTIVSAFAM